MNNFVVNSLDVHRILITSIMLAAKFFDDFYYNNSYYALVGGVPTAEINCLEIDYLFHISFNLYVSAEDYRRYFKQLIHHASSETICPKCHQYLFTVESAFNI